MAESNDKGVPVHPDREQLFGNEAFAIGMLQVVAGGAVVASISQITSIIQHAGKLAFLLFLTLMAFALFAAILAAYWRHQYKMWDVKRILNKANFSLIAMRRAMLSSVILVVAGVLWLVGAMWYVHLCMS